mmetsp:Transcript_33509/g.99734  ORF Transcript_33509/g.99734 Transcript_33509/m.99734 type:complete len:212 (-) Transcript_33509:882-1517(-)
MRRGSTRRATRPRRRSRSTFAPRTGWRRNRSWAASRRQSCSSSTQRPKRLTRPTRRRLRRTKRPTMLTLSCGCSCPTSARHSARLPSSASPSRRRAPCWWRGTACRPGTAGMPSSSSCLRSGRRMPLRRLRPTTTWRSSPRPWERTAARATTRRSHSTMRSGATRCERASSGSSSRTTPRHSDSSCSVGSAPSARPPRWWAARAPTPSPTS